MVAIHGKLEDYRGSLQMTNPVVDLIGDRTGRIVPIYPQSEKVRITTWELAALVDQALRRCNQEDSPTRYQSPIRNGSGLWTFRSTEVDHGPDSMADATAARRRSPSTSCFECRSNLFDESVNERTSQGIEHVVGGGLSNALWKRSVSVDSSATPRHR